MRKIKVTTTYNIDHNMVMRHEREIDLFDAFLIDDASAISSLHDSDVLEMCFDCIDSIEDLRLPVAKLELPLRSLYRSLCPEQIRAR